MKQLQQIRHIVAEATHLNCDGAYSMDTDEAFEAIEKILHEELT